MLRTRALSAAVKISLVAVKKKNSGWLLVIAVLVVSVLAVHEFFRLMKEAGYLPSLAASKSPSSRSVS